MAILLEMQTSLYRDLTLPALVKIASVMLGPMKDYYLLLDRYRDMLLILSMEKIFQKTILTKQKKQQM